MPKPHKLSSHPLYVYLCRRHDHYLNENDPMFSRYGERFKCPEWIKQRDMVTFVKWAEDNGYEEGVTSITRINHKYGHELNNLYVSGSRVNQPCHMVKNNTSGYVGVSVNKHGGWTAKVRVSTLKIKQASFTADEKEFAVEWRNKTIKRLGLTHMPQQTWTGVVGLKPGDLIV